MAKTTKTISISVPFDVCKELEAYANNDERSISYVATKALKEFFDRKRIV